MGDAVDVSVQATPNPNAVKFTLNRTVATQGTTYRDAGTAAPWAKGLLELAGVTQVFAVNNFISVTKTPEASWEALVPEVEAHLRQAFA